MCGRGGIGRRAALRSLFCNKSGSSSLLDRTIPSAQLTEIHKENHSEERLCHTFRTQTADQVLIITIDMCPNTQSKHMAISLGNPCLIILTRQLNMLSDVLEAYLKKWFITSAMYILEDWVGQNLTSKLIFWVVINYTLNNSLRTNNRRLFWFER